MEIRKEASTRELLFSALQMLQVLAANVKEVNQELKEINGRGRTVSTQQAVQRAEFEACQEFHELLTGRRSGNGGLRETIGANSDKIVMALVGAIVILVQFVVK